MTLRRDLARAVIRTVLLHLTLLLACILNIQSTASAQHTDPLVKIRQFYFASVGHESAIEPTLSEIRQLRSSSDVVPGTELDAVLTAYSGAVVTLKAKHAVWPPTRLRHLREGLAVLDVMVDSYPRNPEIRYLRLMSCFYLPGILGRKWSVRDDLVVLAELLPGLGDEYPPELRNAIIRFVLRNGELSDVQRGRLEREIRGADE